MFCGNGCLLCQSGGVEREVGQSKQLNQGPGLKVVVVQIV